MRSDDIPQLAINVFDEQYRNLGAQAQRLYPNESLIRFLAANYFSCPFAKRRKIKILEIGCGSGANLWMLAKENFSVYGLDGSSEALSLAKTELHNKWGVSAKLDLGSFIDLPYPDDHFDAVVDVVSLQHLDLESSTTALREVRRVLKRGGRFFSYRLSDHSVMYSVEDSLIDDLTLLNISSPRMPLRNNGPTSFWSPGSVKKFMVNKVFL